MLRTKKSDLTGQVIVVTGANAGIGKETAVGLAAMGATVVMAARDRAKGELALAEVRRRSGNDLVDLGLLDLGSFASVQAFAQWVLDRYDRLDVLVNNAGLITDTRRETTEGFEEMFGVNHLGHFLLTSLLRERLIQSSPSRVVVLSSVVHRLALGGLDRTDLQSTRSFEGFAVYCQTKLANALFAAELARQLATSGVSVSAVHPGSIRSRFGRDGDTGALAALTKYLGWLVLRSPKAGARTSVLLASSNSARVAGSSGGYWSHGRRWWPSRHARDAEAAAWLWAESERLIAAAS